MKKSDSRDTSGKMETVQRSEQEAKIKKQRKDYIAKRVGYQVEN
jgi:hypothetical protein